VGGLRLFVRLAFILNLEVPAHQMQIVDLTKLGEILEQFILQLSTRFVQSEPFEVEVMPRHALLESKGLELEEALAELFFHGWGHVQLGSKVSLTRFGTLLWT
jgi:hypothetical protein